MTELSPVIEIELAEDVKGLIKYNDDVKIEEALKEKIENFDNDDLLKVTKKIGSFEILDVKKVTEELLAEEL